MNLYANLEHEQSAMRERQIAANAAAKRKRHKLARARRKAEAAWQAKQLADAGLKADAARVRRLKAEQDLCKAKLEAQAAINERKQTIQDLQAAMLAEHMRKIAKQAKQSAERKIKIAAKIAARMAEKAQKIARQELEAAKKQAEIAGKNARTQHRMEKQQIDPTAQMRGAEMAERAAAEIRAWCRKRDQQAFRTVALCGVIPRAGRWKEITCGPSQQNSSPQETRAASRKYRLLVPPASEEAKSSF